MKQSSSSSSHGERLLSHDGGHERPLVRGPRQFVALLEQLDHRRVVEHREVLQEQGVAVEVDARLGATTAGKAKQGKISLYVDFDVLLWLCALIRDVEVYHIYSYLTRILCARLDTTKTFCDFALTTRSAMSYRSSSPPSGTIQAIVFVLVAVVVAAPAASGTRTEREYARGLPAAGGV